MAGPRPRFTDYVRYVFPRWARRVPGLCPPYRRAALSPHRGAGGDPPWRIALRLERREKFLRVREVGALDRMVELRALGGDVEQQTFVLPLEDVGAELAQPAGDVAEHARLV